MSDEILIDPAELVVEAEVLLRLLQDEDLCEKRLQWLKDHPESPCLLPLSQLTALRPMLRAIQDGVLLDEISAGRISSEGFAAVCRHPDALWAVHNTMLEVLNFDFEDDSPAVATAAQKLRLIHDYNNPPASTAPPSTETAKVTGMETRSVEATLPSLSVNLTDPLPWLLLWQQHAATLRIQKDKWMDVLAFASNRRTEVSGGRGVDRDVLVDVAIESLIQHHMRSEPLTCSGFTWDLFSFQTACDIVLGRAQSGEVSWQREIKESLLLQKANLRVPRDLYKMRINETVADDRMVDRLLTRLKDELQSVQALIESHVCDNPKTPVASSDIEITRQV